MRTCWRDERRIVMEKTVGLEMNDTFNEKDIPKYIASYMFIKGYATGKKLNQTLLALSLARRLHENQYRKGEKLPYIVHPIKVCTTLISYGIEEDIILAAALLHDVLEDCKDFFPLGGKELVDYYGFDEEVLVIVKLLTKESGLNQHELNVYFKAIEENPKAALIKLSDRLHNSATLYTFTYEKMKKYIRETEDFLIPMASYCKKYYVQYNNAFTILKTNISALNMSAKNMMEKHEVSE